MKFKKVISVLSTSFLMANITNLGLVNATGGEKGKLGYNELAIINRYKAMGTDEKFSMISKRCAEVCSNSPADFAYDFLNIFAEGADLNPNNNGINSFRNFPIGYNYNGNLLAFLTNCNVDMFEHIDVYEISNKYVNTVEELDSMYLKKSEKFTNNIKDILLEFTRRFPSNNKNLISYGELCNVVLRLCSYSKKCECYMGDCRYYGLRLYLVFPSNCRLISPGYTEKDKYILDAIKYLYYKLECKPKYTESGEKTNFLVLNSNTSIIDYVHNGLDTNIINRFIGSFSDTQRKRMIHNITINFKKNSHICLHKF